MKKTLILSLVATGLITALVTQAAESKKHRREQPSNVVAYLGVASESVDPAMAKQLKLRKGEGLSVVMVDEKSPAADLIKEDDILKQLDDQILVNPEQLRTLVRMHKPGDEVTVSLIHEGDAKKVSVKLGEHEVTPEEEAQARMQQQMQGMPDEQLMPFMQNFRGMPRGYFHQRGFPGQDGDDADNEADTPSKGRNKGKSDGETKIELTPKEDSPTIHMRSSQSMTEDGVSATLNNDNGDKHLKVTKGGKTLFDGPVNTDGQIKSLSGDAKEMYEKLNKSSSIKIETKSPGSKPGSRVDI